MWTQIEISEKNKPSYNNESFLALTHPKDMRMH